jgi:hypothetical protein
VSGWRGRRFFVGTQPIGARSQAAVPVNLSCRIEIDDGLGPGPCAQTHYRETEEMGCFE